MKTVYNFLVKIISDLIAKHGFTYAPILSKKDICVRIEMRPWLKWITKRLA